ncbi:SpoIIE family protein phosphatase/ATP-binding protein [Streptomyces sp. 891-h]|uniref:SpoIIE family protein phosphatase/ATP-binding protein n=1 Tax=unclassified Streptomyces TaxID=2593676 RepID=UPI001FA98C20|nr:SpoIIE family protein phosphatase/ATP-binding protein [Streptomyces sp. 891-h]UNZ16004.1 SpoIIE family protein phosphatase [Streptomyces sp. 891-h]
MKLPFRRPGTRPERQSARSGGQWRSLLRLRSAAGQVFVLQVGLVLLLVAAAVAAQVVQARQDASSRAREKSVAVAQAFAHAPGVADAIQGPDPAKVLQPRAEAARKDAGVDFIVLMDRKGIRFTQPDPSLIGKKFVGTIEPSLRGRTTIERVTGPRTGGDIHVVQAVVPVRDSDGRIVGLASAGLAIRSVTGMINQQLPIILGAGAAALVAVTAGTALISRRLLRQTHGLGPAEMTRMYEHHDAVLHAVREGVLILDSERRLLLANDEARRLLDLPTGTERRHVAELGLDEGMVQLLASGKAVTDEVRLSGNLLLAVNIRPTAPHGDEPGSVVTLRDTTELSAVSGRAQVARERLKLLYESGVRIGTTLDVARTATELAEVAVPGFADLAAVDLLDEVVRGQEPDSQAQRRVRRVTVSDRPEGMPLYEVGEAITFRPGSPQARALEAEQAVLEPDLHRAEEWLRHDPDRARRTLEYGVHSLITVPLRARGVVLGIAHFWRSGDSPAFDEDDVSFSEELAARAAVAIDNARRYTREHAMAVTLQRSLLPRGLPEHAALEAAWRYVPAEAGVGGDWFDVIPLSGARVALVVGDVVGHGLHAAATMGRLRTAVHNFSSLDLAPDEVLAHLDELVVRIDDEDSSAGLASGRQYQEVAGATCLYAIYDPVTGSCTLARAGHHCPAVVYPDGTVSYADVPASPPLGLGGHPFETTELRLPEGAHLVLYTDGLVETRDRDIDTGLEILRQTLEGTAGSSPEETARAVADTVMPAHPSDDVALLVARTRRLDLSQVAEWEVPPDPAAVAPVRTECAARLREWGLEEIGHTTELILSELITNAIRYGRPPIQVRLLHDADSLICEVSDGSGTSPHLRRASTMDEGGRGLFLVAQFAQRWGTRYIPGGKVIWTEQHLRAGPSARAAEQLTTDALLDQFDDTGW